MDKSYYRQKAIKKLRNMDNQLKKDIEQKLYDHLFMADEWIDAQTIGITVSLNYEWDTKPIIKAAWEDNKVVAVPKSYPNEQMMGFYKVESYDELEDGHYKLLEPNPNNAFHIKKESIDLLIVPGLFFDVSGYRVGFGGGYYDRYLKNFLNPTLSLASESLIVDELPRDCFDIPVDQLILESRVLK